MLTGIGNTDLDFTNNDIDINNFPDLKETDYKRITVDQSSNSGTQYKSACTIVSTLSAILSYLNLETTDTEKQEILDYCIKNGYVVGKGWTMKEGVNFCIKAWNELHPDKEMMYVFCEMGDDFRKEILQKGYAVMVGLQANEQYGNEKKTGYVTMKDGILGVSGHQLSLYIKDNKYMQLNQYPGFQNNEYKIKYPEKLSECGIYDKGCYAILPKGEYDLDKIKQKKLLYKSMVLNVLIASISKDQKEKEILMKFVGDIKTILDNNY